MDGVMRMRRHGFTLIELLVVVAIIVALLAILLPSMNRAVALAERAICVSNQRQIMGGALGFAADHQRKFAPIATYGWEYQLLIKARSPGHDVAEFVRYVPQWQVFYCPSRTGLATWGGSVTPADRQWDWQANYAAYGGHIEHLVDYWLYLLAGHNSAGVLQIGPLSITDQPAGGGSGSDTTTITCFGEGLGVVGVYAGNTYPSIHGRDGLPSAFLDGHGSFVPRSELVYDGRAGIAEILRARKRPYIGQQATPHPSSAPVPAGP
jgi:prepilin-type N-terminal cleavage/methylation domain-containing protein